MTDFEFVDVPAHAAMRDQRTAIYYEFAAALRARPGEWAKWPRPLAHPRPMMSGINKGMGKCPNAFREDPRFEAIIYEGALCVRWNGVKGEER